MANEIAPVAGAQSAQSIISGEEGSKQIPKAFFISVSHVVIAIFGHWKGESSMLRHANRQRLLVDQAL